MSVERLDGQEGTGSGEFNLPTRVELGGIPANLTPKAAVFLLAQDAELLNLSVFLSRKLPTAGPGVVVLECELVSDEGPYLRVQIRHRNRKTGKESVAVLMIPHKAVLMVVQKPDGENPIGFLHYGA